MYGEYLSLDGTHWVDSYGHVLIAGTVKDCLGRTQIGFMLTAPSEDLELLTEATNDDNFKVQPGGTLHTDGAPVFAALSDVLGRDHQLCSNHYGTKQNGAVASMAGDEALAFKTAVGQLLYEHLEDGDALDSALHAAKRRCPCAFITPPWHHNVYGTCAAHVHLEFLLLLVLLLFLLVLLLFLLVLLPRRR
jgi:hypothetical protein